MGAIKVGDTFKDLDRRGGGRILKTLKHHNGQWLCEDMRTGHVSYVTGRNLLKRFERALIASTTVTMSMSTFTQRSS